MLQLRAKHVLAKHVVAKHVVAKPRCARGKSFLALFFKKALLSFLAFA
jgi:hypothetical protein